MNELHTARLQELIDQFHAGDGDSLNELLKVASDRLERLTRKMLKSHPDVHRWEKTEDVAQNAMLRLCKSLKTTRPESVRHFLNLATPQIRREQIDLARHHFGPEGTAGHYVTDQKDGEGKSPIPEPKANVENTKRSVVLWDERFRKLPSSGGQRAASS